MLFQQLQYPSVCSLLSQRVSVCSLQVKSKYSIFVLVDLRAILTVILDYLTLCNGVHALTTNCVLVILIVHVQYCLVPYCDLQAGILSLLHGTPL